MKIEYSYNNDVLYTEEGELVLPVGSIIWAKDGPYVVSGIHRHLVERVIVVNLRDVTDVSVLE